MLDPERYEAYPSYAAQRRMWAEVRFLPEPFGDPEIDECLNALRDTRINGGVRLGCYRVSEHQVFDYFAARNGLEEVRFFENFLALPAVGSLLPDPGDPECAEDLQWPPAFEWGSSFTFDGEIAERLVWGGCYRAFPGTPPEAVEVARRFRGALYGERYTEVRPYRSFDRWHPWFHYVEHTTWLLVDKRYRRIWLLCLTDTD
jgi:hypothetical protein